MEEDAPGDMKAALIGKYRYVVLSRLTARDLRELQALVREETGADRAIDPEVRLRLMFRLRQYFPEDVLRREIAGIEALLLQLGPEDLRRDKS